MIKKTSSECSIDISFQQSADSSTENQTYPINQAYQIDGPLTQSTITPEEPVMVVESNKIETPITSRSAESQTDYQAINQISDKQPLFTSYLLRSLIHETSFNILESVAHLPESIKLEFINEEFDDKLSNKHVALDEQLLNKEPDIDIQDSNKPKESLDSRDPSKWIEH